MGPQHHTLPTPADYDRVAEQLAGAVTAVEELASQLVKLPEEALERATLADLGALWRFSERVRLDADTLTADVLGELREALTHLDDAVERTDSR